MRNFHRFFITSFVAVSILASQQSYANNDTSDFMSVEKSTAEAMLAPSLFLGLAALGTGAFFLFSPNKKDNDNTHKESINNKLIEQAKKQTALRKESQEQMPSENHTDTLHHDLIDIKLPKIGFMYTNEATTLKYVIKNNKDSAIAFRDVSILSAPIHRVTSPASIILPAKGTVEIVLNITPKELTSISQELQLQCAIAYKNKGEDNYVFNKKDIVVYKVPIQITIIEGNESLNIINQILNKETDIARCINNMSYKNSDENPECKNYAREALGIDADENDCAIIDIAYHKLSKEIHLDSTQESNYGIEEKDIVNAFKIIADAHNILKYSCV